MLCMSTSHVGVAVYYVEIYPAFYLTGQDHWESSGLTLCFSLILFLLAYLFSVCPNTVKYIRGGQRSVQLSGGATRPGL